MKKAFYCATLLLLAGSTGFAQSNVTVTPGANDKQSQLFAGDVSTYEPEDSYSLPWGRIMEDNILWKKRVWRDIDAHNDANKPMMGGNAAAGNLATILANGFFTGAYKAYSAQDDRFTTPLTKEQFIALLTPGSQGVNPAEITKYRIKEDWLFLASEKKMVVRIVGIAPVRVVTDAQGKATEQPLFWLYYPDTRNFLAQQKVIDNEHPFVLNWDQLFETRQFSSKIDKVTDTRVPPSEQK